MTPQEKAKELVDKFYWRETFFNVSFIDSKQCALIVVKKIKSELEREQVFERLEYWDEVEQEIQAL